MTAAFIFPGQGSQSVGMGKALADNFVAARNVFEAVDEALQRFGVLLKRAAQVDGERTAWAGDFAVCSAGQARISWAMFGPVSKRSGREPGSSTGRPIHRSRPLTCSSTDCPNRLIRGFRRRMEPRARDQAA